ncbi:hypothetical protein [Vibrio superstes]|uniref:Uncharacterized protein n=1 Tax=Vibrio superstes NBRC 103154 TaxID=1219062 RepID=A0A511QLP4_9VIBR|nr:hypothetical protein [Vibrio superstes]GEM77916.1 hypothetical protein VSU01S_01610 [Vibrio superstes NBRC 103154]
MTSANKQKVKDLLIATRYGISASEMKTVIDVEQQDALAIIAELKSDGEDIQSLGEGMNPEYLVLYSIGEIEP